METKKCKTCGRELPETMFKLTRWGSRAGVCTECAAQKARTVKMECAQLLRSQQEEKLKEARYTRLSEYTPRELMTELARRGFTGTLTVVREETIDISKFAEQ